MLRSEVKDPFGNTHYVFEGSLYATNFVNAKVGCLVYPDDQGDIVRVDYEGPISVVYYGPIPVGDSLATWMKNQSGYDSFFAHCTINGLIFYSDVVVMMGWDKPMFPSAHTSEYDDGDFRHELAKELILHATREEWNENFVNKYLAMQAKRFIQGRPQ